MNKQVVAAEVRVGAATFVAAGLNEELKCMVESLHLSLLLCNSGYRCRVKALCCPKVVYTGKLIKGDGFASQCSRSFKLNAKAYH